LTPVKGGATLTAVNDDNNPTIAPLLRYTYALVGIIVIAGASLFFVPDLLSPRWPWPIAPFNARFLGTIYLAELLTVTITVVSNRWAPARFVLWMSFVFVTIVTLVSFLYLDRFDFRKWTTWAWFFLYTIPVVGFAYYLWSYRSRPPTDPGSPPPAWRAYLLAEGAVYGLYGVGLLVAPAVFSSFWPWKIDSFHAQIYSALFIGTATGILVLSRAAAPIEFFTMGVSQIAFGSFAILGLVIVDVSAHRVNWTAPGTWLWIAGLLVLAVAGVGMVWWSSVVERSMVDTAVPGV
jgi:hypothetical protein